MKDFPEIIKDNDIELRRIKPTFEFAKQVFEIVNRNREYLGRWLPWAERIKTIEDEYDGLMHIYNGEWSYFIFLDKVGWVGSVGFVKREPKNKKLEIGYWLDKDVCGRGIMTRAVSVLEKMVLETGEWDKIEIHCDVLNIPSQNVAKRCGYHLDGVLRQDVIYPDGTAGDRMIFSKLKSEISQSLDN